MELADLILIVPKSYLKLKNEYFSNNYYHKRNSAFTVDIPGDESPVWE